MSINIHRQRFALFVAIRYFFTRKKQNVVHIIALIAMAGISLATFALVCVMSVFNGFEQLVHQMFGAFDPDLKIEAVEGKTFDLTQSEWNEIRTNTNILNFVETIEDNALLICRERQMPATIKGVSNNFAQATLIDSLMYEGKFCLRDHDSEYGVLGIGLAYQLGIGSHYVEALQVYVPKRSAKINTSAPWQAFHQRNMFVSGIFSIGQPDYDDHLMLVPIETARTLFERDSTTVSAIELHVAKGKEQAVQQQLKELLGNSFTVKNKFEQQADFFKIMQIEKWITFLILAFILLIATFNIIGSLSMLIIDKEDDRRTLLNLGADTHLVKQIFLLEGWLISLIGALTGIVTGIAVCLSQQLWGWFKIGPGFVTEIYPVQIQFWDILIIFATVTIMGFFAAYYPVHSLKIRKNEK